MKQKLISAIIICGIILTGTNATAMTISGREKIRVLKIHSTVFIRSYFSPDKDIVVAVGMGSNKQITFRKTWLVDDDAPMNVNICKNALMIHHNTDDSTPWNLNGTYIGANHGCSDALELEVAGQSLTKADLGTEWTDAKKRKFYIIKILSPDKIWILSQNTGKGDIWKFYTKINGKVLKNKAGKNLKIISSKRTQIIPACRIQKQEYLIDGKKALPNNKVVTCNFLDVVENYDIIAPDSLLEKIKKNPGKNVKFNSKDLDSVLTNNIVYRFQPRGACTVLHNSTINRNIKLGYMGFIQTSQLFKGEFDTYEYHIPKSLPFEVNGTKYDFSKFYDFSKKLKNALYFNKNAKNIVNSNDPIDRWIQILSNKGKQEVGYVVGYSLIDGVSRPLERSKNISNACFLHTSNKTYPTAIDDSMGIIPAGKKFQCLAYRQYFSPAELSSKSFSSYIHKQGDCWVLYLHYNQPVSLDIIKLPAILTGKKVSIIENTLATKLLSGKMVPAQGIKISSKKDTGYIVLKIT